MPVGDEVVEIGEVTGEVVEVVEAETTPHPTLHPKILHPPPPVKPRRDHDTRLLRAVTKSCARSTTGGVKTEIFARLHGSVL